MALPCDGMDTASWNEIGLGHTNAKCEPEGPLILIDTNRQTMANGMSQNSGHRQKLLAIHLSGLPSQIHSAQVCSYLQSVKQSTSVEYSTGLQQVYGHVYSMSTTYCTF